MVFSVAASMMANFSLWSVASVRKMRRPLWLRSSSMRILESSFLNRFRTSEFTSTMRSPYLSSFFWMTVLSLLWISTDMVMVVLTRPFPWQ